MACILYTTGRPLNVVARRLAEYNTEFCSRASEPKAHLNKAITMANMKKCKGGR